MGAGMADGPEITVILGATASGKSETAAAVARHLDADILSVDSMQVYRAMDIGTAKPTAQERAEVRHHLVDVVNPDEEFTVARFVELADEVLVDAKQKRRRIVVTGGTPLYYKSLFEGLFEGPSADVQLREQLRSQPPGQLHLRLQQVDRAAAERIHVNDTRRLVRALEVFELTGKPISEHQTEWAMGPRRYQAVWIGLSWEKGELNRRINGRVKTMINNGWSEEVQQLLARYGNFSKTAAEATGYRQMIQHVRGELSLNDAVEQIKIATRQLARRQIKWFRRFTDVRWIDGNLPLEDRVRQVLEFLQ